jgi:hypothetical protein
VLKQSRSTSGLVDAGLQAAAVVGRQRTAQRANAISRQPFLLGTIKELLPVIVAGPQAVGKLLLAARHGRQCAMVGRGQQRALLRKHLQERSLHIGQFGQQPSDV